LVMGSNGTTIVEAAAATGTGTSTTCPSHNWVSTISSVAAPSCSQPAIGDLSSLSADTFVANATAGSAAPTAVSMPTTAHGIWLAEGTASAPSVVGPGATSGIPLIAQGSSADPIYGTAVVAGGGTGDTSVTAYGP